jgi:RNA polymerase sigma-70 factor (ECF subfamily)
MTDTTRRLQGCLDRLRAGEPAARNELLAVAAERLRRLAGKMLKAEGRLPRWEESGDVCQNAVLRLCRALESERPGTPREFFRLAALQVRRELIDLARRHYGPRGAAAHHESRPPQQGAGPDPADVRDEPSAVAAWGEFHEKAGELPDEEREAFDLVYYQGLSHAEAAALLGLSARTVQRRWQAACVSLYDRLGGALPEL